MITSMNRTKKYKLVLGLQIAIIFCNFTVFDPQIRDNLMESLGIKPWPNPPVAEWSYYEEKISSMIIDSIPELANVKIVINEPYYADKDSSYTGTWKTIPDFKPGRNYDFLYIIEPYQKEVSLNISEPWGY